MPVFMGISFPFRQGAQGSPASATDKVLIKQTIAQLIGVVRGERVMRPEIGLSPYDLIFENMTPSLFSMIRADVSNLIATYEPRVVLRAVNVSVEESGDMHGLVIDIQYEIPALDASDAVKVTLPIS